MSRQSSEPMYSQILLSFSLAVLKQLLRDLRLALLYIWDFTCEYTKGVVRIEPGINIKHRLLLTSEWICGSFL